MMKLFYPEHCVICDLAYGEEGDNWICFSCAEALDFFDERVCRVCSRPVAAAGTCRACRRARPSFRRLYSAGPYDGTLRALVKAAKIGEYHTALWPVIERLRTRVQNTRYDSIVPVPSDHRLNDLLARFWADQFHADIVIALRRQSRARRQVGLSRKDRRANARKAFEWSGAGTGARVLLIDDLVTTGATIDACAALLRSQSGAETVDALVLARVT